MRLNDLLREIQYTRLVLPKDEVEVSGVNIDSRLVEAGGMFIAIKGTQADGHAYIPSAAPPLTLGSLSSSACTSDAMACTFTFM